MKLQKLSAVFCGLTLCLTASAISFETFYDNSTGSPIFKLLQSAKTSIDIEIYQIEDTQVQEEVFNALNRGVKVRVIQEPKAVGTNCPVFETVHSEDDDGCRGQKRFIQKVRKQGGDYVPYSFQTLCNGVQCLEHGKLILIDGKKAMISTGNFNATNLCDPGGVASGSLSTCNRDYTVVSSDPSVVASLSAVFNADFKGNAYDLSKIVASKAAQRLTVSPYSLAPIVQFINSSKQSILLENQYLKDKTMNAALIAAAKRGVNVYVVVSSTCAFGKPDPQRDASAIGQWTSTYQAFDKAGIKSRMFTKNIKVNGYNGYLHSKAIVVDGSRAWVGSVNGSTQALSQNREYGIFMDDAAQVAKLVKIIVSDFNHPNTESWQESLLCKKD